MTPHSSHNVDTLTTKESVFIHKLPDFEMRLQRVLEPAPASEREEASIYDDMNFDGVNRAFVESLRSQGEIGTRVLDLGCGPCHIPILLCQSDPEVRVLALDASVEMLELAKRNVDLGGMIDRISLQHADVYRLDVFEDEAADAVISNSLVHHLADPAIVFREAARLVRPGGLVFMRDLFRPDNAETVESLVAEHCDGEPEAARQLLRQSLHAALTLDEAKCIAADFGMSPDCLQQTSDRHWTLCWRKP